MALPRTRDLLPRKNERDFATQPGPWFWALWAQNPGQKKGGQAFFLGGVRAARGSYHGRGRPPPPVG